MSGGGFHLKPILLWQAPETRSLSLYNSSIKNVSAGSSGLRSHEAKRSKKNKGSERTMRSKIKEKKVCVCAFIINLELLSYLIKIVQGKIMGVKHVLIVQDFPFRGECAFKEI